jgi:hypothetical protein
MAKPWCILVDLSSVEWGPKSIIIHFDRAQPERIPLIT